LILSIPIGNFVRKLIKNRKKGRIDQYGVTVPNKRDKEKLKPKDSLSLGKE